MKRRSSKLLPRKLRYKSCRSKQPTMEQSCICDFQHFDAFPCIFSSPSTTGTNVEKRNPFYQRELISETISWLCILNFHAQISCCCASFAFRGKRYTPDADAAGYLCRPSAYSIGGCTPLIQTHAWENVCDRKDPDAYPLLKQEKKRKEREMNPKDQLVSNCIHHGPTSSNERSSLSSLCFLRSSVCSRSSSNHLPFWFLIHFMLLSVTLFSPSHRQALEMLSHSSSDFLFPRHLTDRPYSRNAKKGIANGRQRSDRQQHSMWKVKGKEVKRTSHADEGISEMRFWSEVIWCHMCQVRSVSGTHTTSQSFSLPVLTTALFHISFPCVIFDDSSKSLVFVEQEVQEPDQMPRPKIRQKGQGKNAGVRHVHDVCEKKGRTAGDVWTSEFGDDWYSDCSLLPVNHFHAVQRRLPDDADSQYDSLQERTGAKGPLLPSFLAIELESEIHCKIKEKSNVRVREGNEKWLPTSTELFYGQTEKNGNPCAQFIRPLRFSSHRLTKRKCCAPCDVHTWWEYGMEVLFLNDDHVNIALQFDSPSQHRSRIGGKWIMPPAAVPLYFIR